MHADARFVCYARQPIDAFNAIQVAWPTSVVLFLLSRRSAAAALFVAALRVVRTIATLLGISGIATRLGISGIATLLGISVVASPLGIPCIATRLV